MKTCGYCGRTYDDSQPRCPSCGSTLLRHFHGADTVAAEYDRIKKGIEENRKSRSKILIGIAAAVVLVIIIIVVGIIIHVNNPQREVDSNAQEMYESALNDVNAGRFDSALGTLDSIDTSWSDYNKAISLQQEAVKGMLREKANIYMSNCDYEAIIKLVTTNIEIISSDPEIKSLYDSAASSYREQVLENAEQAFSSTGYQSAIYVINNGLSILPGDAILQAEKDYYLTFAPVDLTSIVPYFEGAIDIRTGAGVVTDTLGNQYSTGVIRGFADVKNSDWNCYCIWDIGGKYNLLTATGIILDFEKGSNCEGSLKIYGDGILLYEKSGIGSQTKPYHIEIDITGVTDLKIEMYGEGNMGAYGISSVLVDVMLHKTR